MRRLARLLPILLAVPILAGAACAAAPEPLKAPPKPAYAARCDDVRFSQGGEDRPALDGAVALTRAPFEIRYVGTGTLPALSLTLTDDVNRGLTNQGRPELWGSAGEFMAHTPTDIPMGRMPRLLTDDAGRSRFAQTLGAPYPEVLRQQVAANPAADAALSLPRAGGGFEPGPAGPTMQVATINGKKIADLPPLSLHLAYFAVAERFGPGQSLLRMSWGTCQLSFQ